MGVLPAEVTEAKELVRAIVKAAGDAATPDFTPERQLSTHSEKERASTEFDAVLQEFHRDAAGGAGGDKLLVGETSRWDDLIHVSVPQHVMSSIDSSPRMPREALSSPAPTDERKSPFSVASRGLSDGS